MTPDIFSASASSLLHFLLCAAVAQLEVIEHRIVLLGKALVGILNGGHIRAHLVGVIGHIRDCHIRIFGRLSRYRRRGTG